VSPVGTSAGRLVLLATVALAPLLAGCPPYPATTCATDGDCPDDYVCNMERFYCQPRYVPTDGGHLDPNDPCGDHSECDDGNVCNGSEQCNQQTHRCEGATLPHPGFHDRAACGTRGECARGLCEERADECIASVSLGVAHSCVVDFGGQVFCFGRNDSSQLGTGDHELRGEPTLVAGLTGIAQVSAGMNFTCARGSAGEVWCWGLNSDGQLGIGLNDTFRETPTQVVGITDAVELSARRFHACALLANGQLWCWGNNENGQLGDLSIARRNQPVQAQLPDGLEIVELATGGYHTCVLSSEGRVWCWGGSWGGQLGDGTTGTYRREPQEVPDLENIVTIGLGEEHSCALATDGRLWCWGAMNIDVAQLGAGHLGGSNVPVEVAGITDAVEIRTGMYHSCARLQDGHVRCWGYNHVGQLGDESHHNRVEPVEPHFSVESVTLDLAAGGSHSCARMLNGAVYCWGDNNWGQIGSGDTSVAMSPAGVTDISDVTEVAAGGFHSCAATAEPGGPSVYCWGLNNNGQLGIGSDVEYDRPQRVTLTTTGAEVHVRASFYHTCAFDTVAWCWGFNWAGQLGTGNTDSAPSPQAVVGLPNDVIDMALGYDHSCVLTLDGDVYCFGNNAHGEIGDGTNKGRLQPTLVSGIGVVAEISSRIWHTCARNTAGEVWCWGYRFGSTPVRINGVTGALSVAAGGEHSCAVDGMNLAWCWGGNSAGALGDGSFTSSDAPVQVATLTDVASVSASWNNTCAVTSVTSGGQAHCWGGNDVGELGTGETVSINSPGRVLGLGTALQISAAEYHTCAVVSGGAASCWGSYGHGQLGSVESSPTLKPVEVVNLPCRRD